MSMPADLLNYKLGGKNNTSMRKGLVDIWFWIGLLLVLLAFSLLAVIQQGAQNSLRPELVPGIIVFFRRDKK